MTSKAVEQLRNNRKLTVEVGKWKFTCSRPTAEQMLKYYNEATSFSGIVRDHVNGWENVIEDDVLGGGGQSVLQFDVELWAEWCSDRPDFWNAIGPKLVDAYKLHKAKIEDAGKN